MSDAAFAEEPLINEQSAPGKKEPARTVVIEPEYIVATSYDHLLAFLQDVHHGRGGTDLPAHVHRILQPWKTTKEPILVRRQGNDVRILHTVEVDIVESTGASLPMRGIAFQDGKNILAFESRFFSGQPIASIPNGAIRVDGEDTAVAKASTSEKPRIGYELLGSTLIFTTGKALPPPTLRSSPLTYDRGTYVGPRSPESLTPELNKRLIPGTRAYILISP